MNFKELWNNRIFRTFLQAAISAGCAAFIDSKPITVIVVIAVATGLSAIMPLIDVDEEEEEIEQFEEDE